MTESEPISTNRDEPTAGEVGVHRQEVGVPLEDPGVSRNIAPQKIDESAQEEQAQEASARGAGEETEEKGDFLRELGRTPPRPRDRQAGEEPEKGRPERDRVAERAEAAERSEAVDTAVRPAAAGREAATSDDTGETAGRPGMGKRKRSALATAGGTVAFLVLRRLLRKRSAT